MIIECQECHARFRLDETRIKGKGARVRCRRCGESILVMKEEGVGTIDETAAAPPAPGQFDINLAVEGALESGASSDAGQEAGRFDQPAPGLFDINQAVGEALEPTLEPAPAPVEPAAPAFEEFVDLGVQAQTLQDEAPPAGPEAAEPDAPSPWEAVVDAPPAPESAPPEYESGIDPFAVAGADFLVPAEQAAPPPLLTETPIELAAEGSVPAAPTPALDDVDLAFEQFLSGSESEFPAESAPPLREAPPEIPLPGADDGLFDLSAAAPPAFEPEPAAEADGQSPFLLNDADALEMLGNRYKAEDGGPAAAEAVPKDEPFSFQLDEESMAVPERTESSPFMHNAAEESMASETAMPPSEEAPETPIARKQPLPPEIPVPKSALRGGRTSGPGGPSVRPAAAILGVLFLALAGAGGYLGFTEGGRGFLRSAIPSLGPLLGGSAGVKKGGTQFDIRNLIGYYDNTSKAGRMFVIKGQVANVGQTARGSIRIHAALLDNTNKMLAEKTVYAGNVLGGEALRVADKEAIEKTLASPFGEGLANMDVAPGKSVPFMVVFLDIPEGIDAYRLEAKEGE
jgi:predicted Zn finger-like uncharacterized protein